MKALFAWFAIAILLGISAPCFSQELDSAELLNNSVKVYNAHGAFSDSFKNTLRKELKDVRVVALGEATHEDGETSRQKVNLVKFLHQELGFEVIAFEYGFYGNWKTNNKLKEQVPVQEATKYSGWAKSKYAYPLYEYIAESHQTASPLHYAGFDNEKVPDGIPNISQLILDLDHQLQAGFSSGELSLLDSLTQAVYGGTGNELSKQLTYAQRNQAKELIHNLRDLLADKKAVMLQDYKESDLVIWDYTLQSFLMDEKAFFAGSYRNIVRDKHMADRVIMMADSIYKGKKIILWGASGHFARNMVAIERNLPENSYGYYPYYQAGDWLFNYFDRAYYSIAFISGAGETGTIYPEGHRFKKYEMTRVLEDWSSQSYEAVALNTEADFLFTSLRNADQESALIESFIAYPLGYQEDLANWRNVFDAFFYIREMVPEAWRP